LSIDTVFQSDELTFSMPRDGTLQDSLTVTRIGDGVLEVALINVTAGNLQLETATLNDLADSVQFSLNDLPVTTQLKVVVQSGGDEPVVIGYELRPDIGESGNEIVDLEYRRENTGLNRMLGSEHLNGDALYGGTLIDFMEGNGGDDTLYGVDGLPFEGFGVGLDGEALAQWKTYAK